jgi:hypothetical protein
MEKERLLVDRAGLSSVMGMCVSVANPRVESTPGSWAVRQGMVYARRMRNERWNAVALESMKRTPSVSVSLRVCVLRMSLHAAQPIPIEIPSFQGICVLQRALPVDRVFQPIISASSASDWCLISAL